MTVIAPGRTERALGLQVKTDRLDVGGMVLQLQEGSLEGIYIPGNACHERRQVGLCADRLDLGAASQ